MHHTHQRIEMDADRRSNPLSQQRFTIERHRSCVVVSSTEGTNRVDDSR